MAEPVLIAPGGGEVVGDAPDRRVEILCDDDALHATWSRFGPGREGADLHVHHRHTDLFYVLEGELCVMLGAEEQVVARPGTLVRVPPLVAHGFRNASATREVRYLNFHAPGAGFADFMRGLRDGVRVDFDQAPPPAHGTRPSSEARIGRDGTVIAEPGLEVTEHSLADAIRVFEVAGEAWALPGEERRHDDHLAALYVLDGALSVRCAGRTLEATAGTWVRVPPGTPYSLAAVGPVRHLELLVPAS